MDPNNPLDFYNSIDMAQYQILSPSLSPSDTAKNNILNLTRPVKSESLLPQQSMSGPSYDYESYQQHTGLVSGSIANTHAINQSLLYGSGMDFDFNSPLTQTTSPFASPLTATMDAASTSPVRQTIDPSSLQAETISQPSSSANLRVYNGFHTNQAAAAAAEAAKSKIKVEAQQIQQQQIIQQQQMQAAQQAKPQKPRVQLPSDPLLDQKITQVLNQLRQQESSMDLNSPESPDDAKRSQSKDLDDMDEDERLLNSEAGKNLTPRERRQLRNKVSARHFRKRRKEMINDLESVNMDLTRQVDALKSEKQKLISDNQNLRKFVEHMISTPNFASYMQEYVLGLNAQQTPVAASPQVAQLPPRQRSSQPFNGLPLIPEQTQTLQMADVLTEDFLNDDGLNDFNNMPMLSTQNSNEFEMFGENTQIYAVMDTPQPSIDISVLSGKTSNFVGHQEDFNSNEEKMEMPALEKCPAPVSIATPAAAEKVETSSTPVDVDFENDPAFALWHVTSDGAVSAVASDKPVEFDTDGLSHVDIFGGIELEKVFERYELVDASEEEVGAALAMERVQRISSTIESVMARLELMTIDL